MWRPRPATLAAGGANAFIRSRSPSPSVHRIAHAARLESIAGESEASPTRQRWQRYEKPQPGHRLQLDMKFLQRIPGTRRRLYQFTAIDDCTRIRVLNVYDRCNQRTASLPCSKSNARHRNRRNADDAPAVARYARESGKDVSGSSR
jgi:hypothetical protein